MTMQQQITNKLMAALQPSHLEVVNESGNHHVPAGSESHFKVVIVSARFESLSRIERHRLLNEILQSELADIHALSLHAYFPKEWQAKNEQARQSPACRGGSKGDNLA